MKVCIKCNTEKQFSEFYKRKDNKDGHRNDCKSCHDTLVKKSTRAYYQLDSTKEKVKEHNKNYWIENKERLTEKNQEKYSKNREKYLLSKKIYYENNREKIIKKNSNRNIKRMKSDPLFRLTNNLRSLIRKSIINRGYKKNTKTENILGIPVNEFINLIEEKFESWMNWNNYGLYNGELNYGWDIDHIIPVSTATSEEDIIKLNHFSNLQPLCSKVNRDIKRDNPIF